ncbi:hypothetical protein BLA60_33245 [Actinophytocola xinjiangensis]|uniref:Uncharacterized protein n=1 Tax=Actinophytocola xinjiangensis TaxID=485602 RepID=A0A7Z1AWA8_9PSEU|nr:hypothetical protein BLA60_33245 [Actinophytocola xinjiangensis]
MTPHTPYITQWSGEREPEFTLIERPGRGIGYLNETLTDRDDQGVLWFRTPNRPAHGEPLFARVHPLRQRRAMRRLLCNVCANPADHTADGTLWLLRDFRDDWPGWPENVGAIEPPICVPCVRLSTRLCPALRRGAVAVRVRRAPIAGVRGALHSRGPSSEPHPTDDITVTYDDPRARWVRAINLVRQLQECTLIDPADLCRN